MSTEQATTHEAENTKTHRGHHYEVADLGDGRFSVLCLDPEIHVDDNGCEDDVTTWPSDDDISEWCGVPVRFFDGGDSPRGVESIFHVVTKTIQVRADDGDSTIEVPGNASAKEIRQAVIDHVSDGDYGEVTETIWVDAWYGLESADEWDDQVTVSIDPEEPDCTHEDGHAWKTPHSLLGGLKENPGCQGHGGGVICKEVCVRCGVQKTTDTWAQRPDTGEQGLESISYQTDEGHDVSWWVLTQLAEDCDDVLRGAELVGDRGDACRLVLADVGADIEDDDKRSDLIETLVRNIRQAYTAAYPEAGEYAIDIERNAEGCAGETITITI